MTDRDAFMRAILSAPDDDVPRLVFADWLDDHDERERAEFIRLQCELAELEANNRGLFYDPPAEASITALRRRERETLPKSPLEWFPFGLGLRRTVSARWRRKSSEFTLFLGGLRPDGSAVVASEVAQVPRRGFVAEVACTAEDWLAHADALFWAEGQTAACPECEGEVWAEARRYIRAGQPCEPCEGKGRVPRPCPPTAQPVRQVRLTDTPDGFREIATFGGYPVTLDCEAGTFTCDRWPGVTSRLPPGHNGQDLIRRQVLGEAIHREWIHTDDEVQWASWHPEGDALAVVFPHQHEGEWLQVMRGYAGGLPLADGSLVRWDHIRAERQWFLWGGQLYRVYIGRCDRCRVAVLTEPMSEPDGFVPVRPGEPLELTNVRPIR